MVRGPAKNRQKESKTNIMADNQEFAIRLSNTANPILLIPTSLQQEYPGAKNINTRDAELWKIIQQKDIMSSKRKILRFFEFSL